MKSPRTPLRVILADDDMGDRLVFKEIFDEMETDTIVHMVNDGHQLIEYLTNENNLLPHIIFLDINMPNMNGLDCLKAIRSNEKYSDISIAIYSTSSFQKDIDETFHYGANIYITKPRDYNKLKNVLANALTAARLNRESDFDKANFVLKI